MKTQKVANMINIAADKLGELRAQMAVLKAEAKHFEELLINSGESVVLGSDYRVTVSRSTRTSVDYKGICEAVRVSDSMIQKFSKKSDVTCVKVKAHLK